MLDQNLGPGFQSIYYLYQLRKSGDRRLGVYYYLAQRFDSFALFGSSARVWCLDEVQQHSQRISSRESKKCFPQPHRNSLLLHYILRCGEDSSLGVKGPVKVASTGAFCLPISVCHATWSEQV